MVTIDQKPIMIVVKDRLARTCAASIYELIYLRSEECSSLTTRYLPSETSLQLPRPLGTRVMWAALNNNEVK
jgi:hypothetical protein